MIGLWHLTPRKSYCDHHLWFGAEEEAGLWGVEGPSTGDCPLAGEQNGRCKPGSQAKKKKKKASHPLGSHRVKSWKLKSSCWPLKEELLWSGKAQANVEGKLGERPVRRIQRCSRGGCRGGWGTQITARLTRRSAQEKSFFFLPGAQLGGRPAASVRRVTLSTTEHRQGS